MMQAPLNASAQIKVRENVILTTFLREISFTIKEKYSLQSFLEHLFLVIQT